MTDQSHYTIEYRIIAASWYHECDKSIADIRRLKGNLKERFDGKTPRTSVIAAWEEKLFQTGSILDLKHTGRPNERGDSHGSMGGKIWTNSLACPKSRSHFV